jgi:GT2 family glycosyltransferase
MGWFLAKPGAVRSIRLRSNVITEPFDFENCIRIQRPDVIVSVGGKHGFDDPRCGFIAYVPCTELSNAEMYMEVETTQREVGYRKLPAPKLDGIAAIKRMLNAFEVRYSEVPRAYDRTIGPAVELLNRTRLAIPPRSEMLEFGQVNGSPVFTIIIPLYGRLDFVEYQLAFLSSHKPAYDYEFLYVLDDPPLQREAERLFNSAYARFQLPFRVLIMEHNVGFAPANNAGLRAARGRYICYLNSDVFPGPPDWLEQLARHLEAHPDVGTVGPVLLYGNGSVQHAGMTFKTLPEFGNWSFGDHPGKGMRPAPASGLSRHISITGACMVMRRSLALEMGGFDEAYVIGDFEDSDLCLRLHAMGLASAVDPTIQLYHLERKSQATSAQTWRTNLTLYNAWVHEKRWADTIATHPLRNGTIVDRLSDAGRS